MKISAIITSRNDNYGGNLKERATLCLAHMIDTFDEVIYVDYNSEDKTMIEEIKEYLPYKGNIKIVTVSPEDHKKLTNGVKTAPMVEVFGRNIGLRRATGDILVSTNIDIIPPTREIMDKFLNTWYDKDTFYTFSRRNVTLEDDFRLEDYVFTEDMRKKLTLMSDKIPVKGLANDPWSVINCCGDFQMAHVDIWKKVKGFEESLVQIGWADTHVQMKAMLMDYKVKGIFDMPVFHILHEYRKDRVVNVIDALKDKHNKNPETWGFSNHKFKEEIL